MRQLTPYLSGEKQGKVIGLTFDDGYRNNLAHAAPLLETLGFSGTLYLVSNYIGEFNHWSMEKNIPRNDLMTRAEIGQWLAAGMDIGAHTQTHLNLLKADPAQARAEIFDSKKDLENSFQVSVDDFCYPYGSYNPQTVDWVKEAGYKTATTTIRGLVPAPGNDLFNLPRVFVSYYTLPPLFLMRAFTNYEDKRRRR